MASSGLRYSQKFCAPDADKILLSSDGVLFQVHHRNLAAHSDAFFDIVAASPKKAGVHVLTEVSQTLELLFQFVYPQRQPDAGALLGHELMMLAEAAEKYRIYSAMQVCKAAMKGLLISMPIEVLTYALRHGHRDLCEDVAPFTLDQDAAFMVKRLERDVFIRWVFFREHVLQILFKYPDLPPAPDTKTHESAGTACLAWELVALMILGLVRGCLLHMWRLPGVDLERKPGACAECQKHSELWYAVFDAHRTSIPFLSVDPLGNLAASQCVEAHASHNVDMGNPSVNVAQGNNAKTKGEPSISETFQASDADIVMSSSDGVLFKLHRTNLAVHSGAFLGIISNVAEDEVVALAEKASTLELLFQFVYPRAQPDLKYLDMDELAALAEAAETYSIYSAMGICKIAMHAAVVQIPLKVLAYAARHGYTVVADTAAPLTIDMDVTEALRVLGPKLFVDWILYREQYVRWYLNLQRKHPACDHAPEDDDEDSERDCPLWAPFLIETLQGAGRSLSAAQNMIDLSLQRNYPLQECNDCFNLACKWRENAGSQLPEGQMLKWTVVASGVQPDIAQYQ